MSFEWVSQLIDGWTEIETDEVIVASKPISMGDSSRLRPPFFVRAGLKHVVLGENIDVFVKALRR